MFYIQNGGICFGLLWRITLYTKSMRTVNSVLNLRNNKYQCKGYDLIYGLKGSGPDHFSVILSMFGNDT